MAVFGKSESDAIDARTLNLTLGSGFAAFIATAVVVFNKSFKAIFGEDLGPEALATHKVAVLVAVIAAFAAIAVADMLSRAWATASKANSTALGNNFVIAAAPSRLKAMKTTGTDEDGFMVAAIRFKPSAPDDVEYLLIKAERPPEWVAGKELALSAR
ncbi:MAG TPA: hypothetical protein VF533_11370 [Solirubrobacteraceae bacterium]|jgi:hypothetical protein